ncbi:MAG: AAA family ATPase, partial [Pontibacterium sp.]
MLELTCNNIGEENEHAEPSLLAILDSLAQSKKIRRLDASFARFLKQQGADDKIACLGAVTSFALGQGHSCFPLAWLTKESLLGRELCQLVGDVLLPFDLEPDQHFISTGEIASPLVIEHHSVYLYRYYHYERTLAQRLLALTANIDVDLSKLHRDLDQIFPTVDASTETDWQKLAAYVALTHQLAVISGGPGTGKTTTVIKLLALLIGQLGSSDEPIIKLTAPTGKAAARLSESISAALVRMNLPQPLQQAIPSEASTLHRLLGVIPNSHEFRHNASNPLHLDVLVVDEASMVDLPLMSRLL